MKHNMRSVEYFCQIAIVRIFLWVNTGLYCPKKGRSDVRVCGHEIDNISDAKITSHKGRNK